ncbi:putative nutrient binding outer membrane protein [Cyclobacterium qasimii M12-11B]|uniref:Putative nutrient binding outer membrane protein n=1 Tax=Cyclobacterium qasimii M12-11B TaxID=641524 RepID=S7WU80_9BACT|nr:putative nutrient binding outer membrane protein [Cyclobacterium qasimii M12-11B]
MKKNSILYKFLLPCLIWTIISCNEDILEIDPTDQYSVETFWVTEEHASAGLTGCYQVLRSMFGALYETDMVTPNAWGYNENGGLGPLARGVQLTTDPALAGKWDASYAGIGRTNTFLDNIDGVTMDGNLKTRMIGEAKFLRALYYFHLVNYFGDVPLILETPDAALHSDLPRSPKAMVLAQILKDLDESSEALPETYEDRDTGRATKGAALSLKARLLLYEEDWSEAAATAKKVIDLNAYTLFPNYRELFMLDNENNEEVIFNVEFLAPRFTNNYDQSIYILNTPAPLKDLVDAYLMKDGLSKEESPLFDPLSPYENRDPRLHQSIACIGYPFNGKITELSDVVNTGFGMKKFTSFSDDVSNIVPPNTELNPIVIRYAEVLLTYAEAQNEAVGPDPSVYEALNMLRARSSVNMPAIQNSLSKEEMRDLIRLERRIELAFEGLYYSDIRRWKNGRSCKQWPYL